MFVRVAIVFRYERSVKRPAGLSGVPGAHDALKQNYTRSEPQAHYT